MSKERLEEIKEHFAYCIDEGLLFAEQEERLLDELYKKIEEQAERVQGLHESLKRQDKVIDKYREQNKRYHEAINEIKELIPIKYEYELELSSALVSIAKTIDGLESKSNE